VSPHFPYDQALQTAINSFNGNIMPILFAMAKAILTVSLLWSLYDAWVKGGDVRSLGINLLKYAVVSIVVLHWNSVFTDIVNGFDSVSYQIYQSAGISDLWTTYTSSLQQAWDAQHVDSIWTVIRGSFSALIAMLGVLAGYILWPIGAVIFVVFYTFWGCVLYGVGPLVLATMPSTTLSRFHVRYIESVFVWNCWGLLVTLYTSMLAALHIGNIQNGFASQNIVGFFGNIDQSLYLSITSAVMSLGIIAIPFCARSILMGEFSPVGAMFRMIFFAALAGQKALGVAFGGGAQAAGASTSGRISGGGGGPLPGASGPPPFTPAWKA
jgi:hypothetical protein